MRTSVSIQLIKRKRQAEIVQEAMEKLIAETKTKLKEGEMMRERLGINSEAIREFIKKSGFSLQDKMQVEQDVNNLLDSAEHNTPVDDTQLGLPPKQTKYSGQNRRKSTFKI